MQWNFQAEIKVDYTARSIFIQSFYCKLNVLSSVGLAPSRVSCVFFFSVSRVTVPSCLRRSENFSREYFVDSKYLLVGISRVSNFSSWVFRGPKIFSRGYFACLNFSLVGNFVIFSCCSHEQKWHWNISQTTYSIPNLFQQLLILLTSECYYTSLVCTSYIFNHLFLGNRIYSLVIEIYSFCKTRLWLYFKVFNKEYKIVILYSKWGQNFKQKLFDNQTPALAKR